MTALARVALGKRSVQVCEVGDSPLQTLGQATDHGEAIEATADLRVYQSALEPFKVAPARARASVTGLRPFCIVAHTMITAFCRRCSILSGEA